jgi:serine phosphatase RsbU (regulator of sigma subunit)
MGAMQTPAAFEPSVRKSILVVEDSDPLRRTLLMQLEQFGFAARGAPDGVAGLEEVRRGPTDLVLCDLRMPRMDGLGLLKALRVSHPDLPVIVMSGAGLLDDAISALKLGAWDYVEKPIPLAEVLMHSVSRAFERAALVAENRRQRANLERVNRELRDTLDLLAVDEDAGRQIQFRMLPPNHQQFGPFEFSRTLVPAAFLSGDFIDAFPIDERRWGFYLADVCGHGVSSALVTVMLRTFVHRQVADFVRTQDDLILSPARMLERLNEEIARDDLEKHVTMFFGIIDNDAETLVYANGGQFPWPLIFDGEQIRALGEPGLPVGVMPRARNEQHELKLPKTLVFAAFSDGLLEILPHSDLRAKEAFLRALFRRPDVTVEQLRRELHLDDGVRLPDDVAILLIKRGEDGHGEPLDRPSVLRTQ